jgi:hypothetical protein
VYISLFRHITTYKSNADASYDSKPSEATLLSAISISRQWSVKPLFDYAYDHLKRRFESDEIHPAIVLGVSRQYGIPSLIDPAVHALANPKLPLSSWSTNPAITCHSSIMDIGIIGRMKEKLLTIRIALCTPPPILHNEMCSSRSRATCTRSWESFWASEIVPRLLQINGEAGSRLFVIRKLVEVAKVPGMMEKCAEQTITDVTERPGWDAEWNIPDGAVRALMVPERVMLAPGDMSDDVMMAEGGL